MKESCLICKTPVGKLSNYGRDGETICYDCSKKKLPCSKCGKEMAYDESFGKIENFYCKICKSYETVKVNVSDEPNTLIQEKPHSKHKSYEINILLAAIFGFLSAAANILLPLFTSNLNLRYVLSAIIVLSLSLGVLKKAGFVQYYCFPIIW